MCCHGILQCRHKIVFYFQDVVFTDEINNECTVMIPKSPKSMSTMGGQVNPNKSVTFSYDRCYNMSTTTAQIYNEIPYSLVQVCCIYNQLFVVIPNFSLYNFILKSLLCFSKMS